MTSNASEASFQLHTNNSSVKNVVDDSIQTSKYSVHTTGSLQPKYEFLKVAGVDYGKDELNPYDFIRNESDFNGNDTRPI